MNSLSYLFHPWLQRHLPELFHMVPSTTWETWYVPHGHVILFYGLAFDIPTCYGIRLEVPNWLRGIHDTFPSLKFFQVAPDLTSTAPISTISTTHFSLINFSHLLPQSTAKQSAFWPPQPSSKTSTFPLILVRPQHIK